MFAPAKNNRGHDKKRVEKKNGEKKKTNPDNLATGRDNFAAAVNKAVSRAAQNATSLAIYQQAKTNEKREKIVAAAKNSTRIKHIPGGKRKRPLSLEQKKWANESTWLDEAKGVLRPFYDEDEEDDMFLPAYKRWGPGAPSPRPSPPPSPGPSPPSASA